MNRRFFIALAVVLPIAVFVPAKIAASWRPVRVGAMLGAPNMSPPTLRVTGRAALVCHDYGACTRFDLTDNVRRKISRETLARDGSWKVALRSRLNPKLELSLEHGATRRAYPIPNLSISTGEAGFEARFLSAQTLRVSPELNRVEMVLFTNYYRWNFATRALEQNTHLPMSGVGSGNGFSEESVAALARDGESVCLLNSRAIEWRSTRDGRVLRRFAVSGMKPSNQTSDQIQVSTFGALALLNRPINGTNSTRWQVKNARTGANLWQFALTSPTNRAVFSPDEKWLALPTDNLRWQIRDARSGTLARSLSRVPNISVAAFSPDGVTLYSVANGVLYRQRAR